MKNLSYNSSHITKQCKLEKEIKEIVKLLKQNFSEFELEFDFENETILLQYNYLVEWCIDSVENFESYYNSNVKDLMTIENKMKLIINWLKENL